MRKFVASDRARRENVPRHILIYFIGKTAAGALFEKEEQAKMLYEMGCDLAQGYYFGKPVPVEEFFRKMNKEI